MIQKSSMTAVKENSKTNQAALLEEINAAIYKAAKDGTNAVYIEKKSEYADYYDEVLAIIEKRGYEYTATSVQGTDYYKITI